MQIIWTESDRRDFERHAWKMIKGMNAPRHVRLMFRDRIVQELMAEATKEHAGVSVGGGGVDA